MSGSVGGAEAAEPNLVPILDMVFQLITFFMLVINVKAATMDQTLQLPVVGSAAPADSTGLRAVVLNINGEGDVNIGGVVQTDIKGYVSNEADQIRLQDGLKKGDDLSTRTIVVVRGDKRAKFKSVYAVVKACQEVGFHRFSYMTTFEPGKEP
ncbi:MAG: biopolymer transporter ExbD [Planctomycetia bacterium]|nr:biopolymer transporter ExbD [Planctomycetia bacterium]